MRRLRFFFFEEYTLLLQITTGYNLEDDRCECVALEDYKKNEQVKQVSSTSVPSVHPGRDNREQQQVCSSFPSSPQPQSLRSDIRWLVVMVIWWYLVILRAAESPDVFLLLCPFLCCPLSTSSSPGYCCYHRVLISVADVMVVDLGDVLSP